jgi:DUSAM domain-containing protein
MTDEDRLDWERVEDLGYRVLQQGEPLELSDEIRAVLTGGARLVAISPTDTAGSLRSISTAALLLREIRRRLRESSWNLGTADTSSNRLREQGDITGARKVLENALSTKTVLPYREQLEIRLEYLATFEKILLTGHVEEDFHPWGQIRALSLRVQRGNRLELRDELRDFLRQTAPSVAISGEEATASLKTVEDAEALLAKILERIETGKQRILQALHRMMVCKETGDLEGARQHLRAVLAVEVVPQYRLMAEENLAGLDEPSQAP